VPAEFVSERYGDSHDASGFDSGEPVLDDWLRKSARGSDGRNLTRTYVWHRGDGRVVAYYAVSPYLVEADDLTKRQRRGQPGRIGCYLLARLALDRSEHGQRFGTLLLADALRLLAQHADDVGGRLIVVDALHDEAASFYMHHGFEPIDGVEGRLVITVKDVLAGL
jgi:GNAT superfamily N-acetyltransferase